MLSVLKLSPIAWHGVAWALLLGASSCQQRKECTEDLKTAELEWVVENEEEWVSSDGEFLGDCEYVCLYSDSGLTGCAVSNTRPPTTNELSQLEEELYPENTGGQGGAASFPDAVTLIITCTYDRNYNSPECDWD